MLHISYENAVELIIMHIDDIHDIQALLKRSRIAS